MGVQFGKWNFDGRPVNPEELDRMNAAVVAYGPDAEGRYSLGNIGIAYRAFHTTKESRSAKQPHISRSGAVLTWDGRLDNRAELVRRLNDFSSGRGTDVEIVAAAYERWGSSCLPALVGDWALVIWNPDTRTLLLGNDFMGARRIYYSLEEACVTWSTVLEPLVRLGQKTHSTCEAYIAGWLTGLPSADLTPYMGICSVPPACLVSIQDGKLSVERYWNFDSSNRIRYKSDAEYEEHFRALFAQSIQRRLRSDRPVLAELSGGMDSSAIVCMADRVIADGEAETPRLDTLSYFSDSEVNWDERPYFTLVEKKRNRSGFHIRTESKVPINFQPEAGRFATTPGLAVSSAEPSKDLMEYIGSQNNRVLLSGVGGDEVLGGVPTATPELADLCVSLELRRLAARMVTWALVQRKPLIHLIAETVRPFLPLQLGIPHGTQGVPWLLPAYIKRNKLAIRGDGGRLRLFGPLPSFQENLRTLEGLRRQLAATPVQAPPMLEKSYPYLDRSLLEFLYAIPREQIIRPGQRRSLMRRALAGIVPDGILNRKRKAFAVLTPVAAISAHWSSLVESGAPVVTHELGIIDSRIFSQALELAVRGRNVSIVQLARTLTVEVWLQQLVKAGVIAVERTGTAVEDLQFRDISAEVNAN